MKINFIIPAYNEEQILEKNALKVFYFLKNQEYHFNWKLSLLINGSSDNSEKIANKLNAENQEIDSFIIHNKGKGNALKTFLDQQKDYDFFIYMDIDLAVSIENINDIVNNFIDNNFDIIIGSRLKKESITDRSLLREISSRLYIIISKIIIGHNFSDLQCGFKGIKRESWIKISPLIKEKEWFFDTELLMFAKIFNFKIKEIPVNWSENRYEKRKSKVRTIRDSIKFIKNLIKLKKRLKVVNKSKYLS